MIAPDRGAAICGRISEGSVKDLGKAGFLHILRDDRDYDPDRQFHSRKDHRQDAWPIELLEPPQDWNQLACDYFDGAGAEREKLAEALGLPVQPLERIGVGWDRETGCWTIPERDHRGRVIGIARRYRNGEKGFHRGGKRGLIYADNWQDCTGPVLLVEGASDVAACIAMNLCAIGRPSNTGGVELLALLLAGLPAERLILVVGERDEKPDGRWPGRDGAISTATKLGDALLRKVGWTFPPDGKKDTREWLRRAMES